MQLRPVQEWDAPQLRRRFQVYVPVKGPAPAAPATHVKWLPASAFVLSVSLYLFVGLWTVAYRPHTSEIIAGYHIPLRATCFRASRTADYTTLYISVGTPFAWLEMLLRLDKVTSGANIRLFSSRIVESNTVTCANSTCADAALMQLHGPNSKNSRVRARPRARAPARHRPRPRAGRPQLRIHQPER